VPTYETLFITPPTLSDDDERATVEGLAAIVTDGGGSFTVNERMGRRRLAYSIRKFDDGVYTRFLYDADVDIPKELERKIRLSENVLRSLTVRLEEDWAVASKIQAVKDAERRAEQEAEAARQAEEEAVRAKEAAALAAEKAAEKPAEKPAEETTEAATETVSETVPEAVVTEPDADAGAASETTEAKEEGA
jgi:small subunit ribosomal protein S6